MVLDRLSVAGVVSEDLTPLCKGEVCGDGISSLNAGIKKDARFNLINRG